MTFDLQPTLHGALLTLRPLRADDFDALFAAASDPLIWDQHPESDRHAPAVFRRFFDEAIASGGALIALNVADGTVIGSSRFHGYNAEAGEVEIGWSFLVRACWGGRYNGEMKQLMLAHAFRYVEDVLFLIGPENWRSRRAVEKIGGELIASRVSSVGRPHVTYRISRG